MLKLFNQSPSLFKLVSHNFFLPALPLLAVYCMSGCEKTPQTYHHSSLHFGTLIDITLYDVSAEQANAAFDKLDNDFAYLHKAWSPWVAGSLSRTNQLLETGKSFSIGPSILPLLENANELAIKSRSFI